MAIFQLAIPRGMLALPGKIGIIKLTNEKLPANPRRQIFNGSVFGFV
jgi:hypothetical protein